MSDHYLKEELYKLVRKDPAIFEFLQAGSLDGIWYWDLENPEIEWMSPRLWEVLGFDAEEMPHRAEAWQHLIHPEDLQTANANFNAHCADPSHPYDQLVRYRHKDGSTVWARCRGVAIRDESNNPIRMLGAHNEVTLLKQAEQELSEAVEHLERSNRNLEEFASVASHDLQAPLQTITNFLTLLQFSADERLTENEQHYIERAVDAAQRQSQMVRALLDWSRVQMHDMSRRPVDTGELVAEVTSELRASLDEANAEVLVDDLPLVRADPVLLRRVFQNLLHNALKLRSERPPRVHIRAQPVRSTWSFPRRGQRHRLRLQVQRARLRLRRAPPRQGPLRGLRHRPGRVSAGHQGPRG